MHPRNAINPIYAATAAVLVLTVVAPATIGCDVVAADPKAAIAASADQAASLVRCVNAIAKKFTESQAVPMVVTGDGDAFATDRLGVCRMADGVEPQGWRLIESLTDLPPPAA